MWFKNRGLLTVTPGTVTREEPAVTDARLIPQLTSGAVGGDLSAMATESLSHVTWTAVNVELSKHGGKGYSIDSEDKHMIT